MFLVDLGLPAPALSSCLFYHVVLVLQERAAEFDDIDAMVEVDDGEHLMHWLLCFCCCPGHDPSPDGTEKSTLAWLVTQQCYCVSLASGFASFQQHL